MDKLLLTAEPFLTGRPLEVWLDSMGIKDWSINADGLVDVEGDVDLERKLWNLKRLPVRFGQVDGVFFCSCNQLVSLEGAPKEVGGSFSCGNNRLASLAGAPKRVGGFFDCRCNQLVSLEWGPNKVVGNFDCTSNQLVCLEGAPRQVGVDFLCGENKLADFKGLEGTSIRGKLFVTGISGQDNVFVSLVGLPKELYSKVRGLHIPTVLELEKKRAASLLGEEGLISEVGLG